RLKVETLPKAIVVPTSAVQRGPAGTFSYVIGDGDIATAKPIVVTQQNESDAVIASGLSASDRVVTTGFANLSDGAKVFIGKDDAAPTADLAPRKRNRAPDGKGGGPSKEGQATDRKRRAAAGRFPDRAGDDATAGRQPRRGGFPDHRAAGAPARANPVAVLDAVDKLVRRQPDLAAVRSQPRHRRRDAGCAGRDQRRRRNF